MCTHSNQGTGYAKSAAVITNHLAKMGNEIVYYAFQNYKHQMVPDRFIDPKIRFIDAIEEDPESPKGFGDSGIVTNFEKEKPDILFIYNDISVCTSILKLLENTIHTNFKIILYLDVVYPWEDIYRYNYLKKRVDLCFVFLNCWKTHIIDDLGWSPDKVKVLPLGVDPPKIIKSEIAKNKLGFLTTDFIVLNMNRNSYRKQWCITIKAFITFLVNNDCNTNIKLFCGCLVNSPDGYDLLKLIETECVKRKLETNKIINKHIFINEYAMTSSDEHINMIYNACDVGLNTCCGEGFGLTNLEHGVLGKPQIVSGVHALKETMGYSNTCIIEPTLWTTVSELESHGGEIAHCDPNKFAESLNTIYNGSRKCTIDINRYTWDNTRKVLNNHFLLGDNND